MASGISAVHNQSIMNQAFRWMIVVVFALLAFSGPFAWARNFVRQLANRVEREMRDALIAEGKTDEAAQLSLNRQLQDIGLELSPADANRILAADVLFKFWWMWALIVLGCSYALFVGLGYLLPATAPNPRSK